MLKENLSRVIADSIRNNWNKPAITDYQDKTFTYEDIGQRILHWHSIFSGCKLVPGDKIAVVGKNSAHWAEIYLSTITYGAVIVPILADFTPENIHHIVNHSDAQFLFASDHVYENLDPTRMRNLQAAFSLNDFNLKFANCENLERKVRKETENSEESERIERSDFALEDIDNQEVASIVYTSGTTGFSKGVILSHNSLMANIRYAQLNMPLASGDSVLSFLPLAHAYACAFEFMFPFSIGCHITFLGKLPSPQVLLKAFSQIKPRLIFLVPLLIEKIYKNKIKPSLEKGAAKYLVKVPGLNRIVKNKVRKSLMEAFGGNFLEVVIGGAALNKEVEDFLVDIQFPFTIGYGMTECGPLISYAAWNKRTPGTVGKVVDTLEIKIDSSDPVNVVGEILVKGENVMNGYFKNQEATEQTLEKDGWLHTGDLGTIDQQGFIFIRGRSKNMLLGPSGQNIYPEEIEAILNNMLYVMESLVLISNQKLIALVVPDVEKTDADKIDEAGLREKMDLNLQQLNQQLPSYSRLSEIRLYPEEFEKTPTKKIKRYLYHLSS
jgi:long-chain acyl-CoA synthetase